MTGAIHQRRMHEEVYHAAKVPKAQKKAHWDDEELVLLAREEICLTRLRVKNINSELIKVLPNRMLESIKSVHCRTNKWYHNPLGRLMSDPSGVDSNGQTESVRGGAPPPRKKLDS